MKLSRPALMSGGLFPGVGQWAAGRRFLGILLIGLSLFTVSSPFVRFFVAVLRPPPCDPFTRGIWGCDKDVLANAWHVTLPWIEVDVPVLVCVYLFAVWHANGLRLPDGS